MEPVEVEVQIGKMRRSVTMAERVKAQEELTGILERLGVEEGIIRIGIQKKPQPQPVPSPQSNSGLSGLDKLKMDWLEQLLKQKEQASKVEWNVTEPKKGKQLPSMYSGSGGQCQCEICQMQRSGKLKLVSRIERKQNRAYEKLLAQR